VEERFNFTRKKMPNPSTHSLNTIAKLLDLSPRRVQQLSKEGIIPRSERGRYELVPSVRGYVNYLRERSIDNGSSVVSLDDARKRKTNAEAEMAEIELAKARASVVNIRDVRKQWDKVMGECRTRILALPTILAPVVAPETELQIVKELMENSVNKALGELAQGISHTHRRPSKSAKSGKPNARKNGTPAATNDQRVGGKGTETIPGS